MPQPPKNLRSFESLVQIVRDLRGPEGCPWDKEQTHETLTRFAIEEAHELAEAIDQEETSAIVEELGDLLLQVVLHSEIGRQKGRFALEDVINSISSKMIRRHPHVFSDSHAENAEQVLKKWSELKKQEKPSQEDEQFAIPPHMPALLRAFKIGEKTQRESFDWASPQEVFAKVAEEADEVREALGAADTTQLHDEIGDLLFSVAQLARHTNCDPEQALRRCNQRFEKRYFNMKKLARNRGQDFSTLGSAEKESLWTEVKRLEAKN